MFGNNAEISETEGIMSRRRRFEESLTSDLNVALGILHFPVAEL